MIMDRKIKTTAIILMVLLIVGGFFAINKSSSTFQPKDGYSTKPAPSSEVPTNIAEINENSTTTASFVGYYTTIRKQNAEENISIACNAFVTHKSNDSLFQYFSKLVQEGNTVNSLDEDDDLILNLDFDHITTEKQKKITSSTKENPIILLVQKRAFAGKGAGPCSSFVDILSIK